MNSICLICAMQDFAYVVFPYLIIIIIIIIIIIMYSKESLCS